MANTHDSKSCGRNPLRVQVPLSAQSIERHAVKAKSGAAKSCGGNSIKVQFSPAAHYFAKASQCKHKIQAPDSSHEESGAFVKKELRFTIALTLPPYRKIRT